MAEGSQNDFRKKFSNPILAGREPGASEQRKTKGAAAAAHMSAITNMFVIRRTNALLSAHLPPKVMQIVAAKVHCRAAATRRITVGVLQLTPLQKQLYNHLLNSKVTNQFSFQNVTVANLRPSEIQ